MRGPLSSKVHFTRSPWRPRLMRPGRVGRVGSFDIGRELGEPLPGLHRGKVVIADRLRGCAPGEHPFLERPFEALLAGVSRHPTGRHSSGAAAGNAPFRPAR
jgi:hypothetical protein